MDIESKITSMLRAHPDGMNLEQIESAVIENQEIAPGVVEVLLHLSDRFSLQTERWFRKTSSKFEIVAEALEQYVQESGRHIFKADNALQRVPEELKPTQIELEQILQQLGTMELRKNNMIRVKD